MGYSDFRRGFEQRRSVANGSVTSGASVAKLQLALNEDNLTVEHILHLTASQAFSVNPSTSDVRRAIDSIVLELTGGPGNGTRLSLDGHQLYDLARFTEDTMAPVVSYGATSTAAWSVDLHHLMHGARNDLQTAINTGLYSGVDLTINFATTANQLFTGGTASGAVSLTVDVEARDYPVIPAQPNAALIASAMNIADSFSKAIGGTGRQDDIFLRSGNNKTRFLMIHARNGSGVLSDVIVDEIEVQAGNWIYKTSFAKVQQDNARERGFSVPGVGVLDFGDDPMGWLPLENIKDARVKWTALATGSMKLAQVRLEPL